VHIRVKKFRRARLARGNPTEAGDSPAKKLSKLKKKKNSSPKTQKNRLRLKQIDDSTP
jgi:hypothetical protein